MKIAFPVQENKGFESPVYGHFGSAPIFIVVDTEGGDIGAVENIDFQHQHGQCQPLKALGAAIVDAIVVGGIGAGALQKLQAGGIKVFRAVDGNVDENLELIKSGKLPEFVMNMTCAGHSQGGGCAH